MAGEDGGKCDRAPVRDVGGNFGGDTEVWGILAPVGGDFRVAAVSMLNGIAFAGRRSIESRA